MTAGWRYVFTGRARRDLKQLDPPVRRRILEALDRLVAADVAPGDVRKLTTGDWRLRVGDWRVRFERRHDQRIVLVTRVSPRGRAYRD